MTIPAELQLRQVK